MPVITVISKEKITTFKVPLNKNVLNALRENGFLLSAPCGGKGVCGKCRITACSFLPTALDFKYLTPEELEQGIRLACDKFVDCDIEVQMEESVLSQIETGFTENTCDVRLGQEQKYAIAFDIGTTTIACYLLVPGLKPAVAGVIAAGNKQVVYGADVITRIQYTMEYPYGLKQLNQCIIQQIDRMCCEVLKRNAVAKESVHLLYFAGNTVMLHLLLGISPAGMGVAPYRVEFLQTQSVSARELGITSLSEAQCFTAPCISAFVGGDITCAALACGAQNWQKPSLLIDIGTNGEILAGDGHRYYCCSAAAGPAFEGGNLRCGMASVPGAVCHVSVKNGELITETINDVRPLGICGSGMIDAVYCMLELGAIDETGYFDITNPFIQKKDGLEGFLLSDNVIITQKDIREFQLAKSAVRSAIELLLKEAGWNADTIETVYLAGGFGSRLDLEKCAVLGLFPKAFLDKIVTVGNASGQGAVLAAENYGSRQILNKFSQSVKNIELAERMDFQEKFMEYIMFECD